MYKTSIQKTEELKIPSGKSVRWLLPKEIGTPNFEMRYFEVGKGVTGTPESHPFEHEVFILKGEGVIESGYHKEPVKAGDAVYIAPDEPHQFFCRSSENLGFICIIPNGREDHLKKRV